MASLSKLKICFLAGTLGMGGAEKQLFYIIRALKEMGADVHLIIHRSGEHWEQPIRETGAKVYALDQAKSFGARVWAISHLLWKIKPDFIQSQHFYTNIHASLAGRLAGVRSIGASRNSLDLELGSHNATLGKLCFRLPRFFVMNSKEAYNQAVAYGRNKETLFYLPNAMDAPAFFQVERKSEEKKPLVILGMGRCVEQKRFDRFIDVIKRLKAKLGEGGVKAIVVGEGPKKSELEQLALNEGLTKEELTFAGKSTKPIEYFEQADIFLLSSDAEGTPNVVLEAMASGLPVVSTRIGNLPFLFTEGEEGYFVEPEERDLMTARLITLAADPELRYTMGQKGRALVQREFSTEALKNNLQSLYGKFA